MNSLKRKEIEDKASATVLQDIKLLAEDMREKKLKAAKLCSEAAESERKLREAVASAEDKKAKLMVEWQTRIEKATEWRSSITRPVTLGSQWVCNLNSNVCAVLMMGPREPKPLVANLIRHLVPDRQNDVTHSLVEWYSEIDGSYHKGFLDSEMVEFSEEDNAKLTHDLAVREDWKPVRIMSLYCEPASIGWDVQLRSKVEEKPTRVPTDGISIRVDWLSTSACGKYSEVEWYANDGQHYCGWVESVYVSLPRNWKGKQAALVRYCSGALRMFPGPRYSNNHTKVEYGNENVLVDVLTHCVKDDGDRSEWAISYSQIEFELGGKKHMGWIDARLLTYPIF